MATDKKHEVRVTVQVIELSKAGSGIELEVFAEGEKLGEIEIGQGSFGWRKASGSILCKPPSSSAMRSSAAIARPGRSWPALPASKRATPARRRKSATG